MGTGIHNDSKEIRMLIKNWDQFDEAMKAMAEIDLLVSEATNERDRARLDADEVFKQAVEGKTVERAALEADLEKFYAKHREEIEAGGKKSVARAFGEAGVRQGTPKLGFLEGFTADKVIAAIKKKIADWKTRGLVIEKEEIDKNAVKKLDAKEQKKIGVEMQTEEKFWVKTYPEKLQRF